MSKRYRVSEYTDFSLGDGLPYCRWVVREGTGTLYWAMTTCKRGFNPLTRVRHVGEIKKVYDGCYCPICGRPNQPRCGVRIVGTDFMTNIMIVLCAKSMSTENHLRTMTIVLGEKGESHEVCYQQKV